LFDKNKIEYKNTAYFLFTISMQNGEDLLQSGLRNPQEYSIKLNYLTTGINKDFYITTEDGEKVSCILSELQRSYGMSPDLTFVLGFPDQKLFTRKGELTLVYEDKVFGLISPVKLIFNTNKLSKPLPAIHI
jgi:hypothetical protein